MTEKPMNGHENDKQNPANDDDRKEKSEKNPDIIELSDIAIGFTAEDEAIVELTEELIGEAFVGFAGATSEMIEEDERILDLSSSGSDFDSSVGHADAAGYGSKAPKSDDLTAPVDMEDDNLADDITKELDNYFGTEDEGPIREAADSDGMPEATVDSDLGPQEEKPVEEKMVQPDDLEISPNQLDDAIERVIRKMFAEKINRILDEVIERTVSEEISQIKEYLIGISGKN